MRLPRDVQKHSEWVTCLKAGPVRLICFAHAGGGAHLFHPWRGLAPPWLGLSAVELPGRGRRRAEPAEVSMARVADAAALAIDESTAGTTIFYGHSLGGLVAFRAAQAWRRLAGREPALLVVGAVAPPTPASNLRRRPPADDAAVLRRIRGLGGMSDLLDHPQMVQFLLPALRGDFALLGDDANLAGAPLTCPVLALYGATDAQCDRDAALAWQDHTRGEAAVAEVGSGHFFHQTAAAGTVACIARRAARLPAVVLARSEGCATC